MTSADEAYNPYAADGAGTSTLESLEGAECYNNWLVSKLEPFLGAHNLELGAGHGTITALVAARRNVVASEPSAVGRSVLVKRFAQTPRVLGVVAGLSDLSVYAPFDAIFSANVLEHVADDVALIRDVAKYLKPGGHLVAVVPAGSWLYSRFDASVGHHRRYSAADRVRLSAMLGSGSEPLELVEFRTFNPVGALGWFYWMRLLGSGQIPVAEARRFDRIVPWLRGLDHLPFPFGQNLLLALKKC